MYVSPQPVGWWFSHPRWVCIAVCVVALVVAPGLTRLELRVDGQLLVSSEDPALLANRAVSERFGVADPIVVYLEAPPGSTLYTPSMLAVIADTTRELGRSGKIGWSRLTSLATEGRDRLDSFDYSAFLTPLPQSPQEIDALVDDIGAVPILSGTLVGADARGASIFVDVRSGDDRAALTREVERVVAPFAVDGIRVHVVGAPVAEVRLGEHLLRDLFYLLPLCLLMVAAVLYTRFRCWWPVVLALCEVAFAMLVVFGALGLAGEPIYLTTLILPVVLALVGLTDEIHLLSAFRQQVMQQPGAPARVVAATTLRRLLRPLTVTSVTTMAAFAAFASSELPPVRSFAVAAVLGVGVCWLWSVLVSPLVLAHVGRRQLHLFARAGAARVHRASVREGSGRTRFVLLPLVLMLGLAMAGVPRIAVQDGWIDNLAEGSELRDSFSLVNEQLKAGLITPE
ncbi:MAG: MMPL family transporter, partial [Pseudomonadota bacterium]